MQCYTTLHYTTPYPLATHCNFLFDVLFKLKRLAGWLAGWLWLAGSGGLSKRRLADRLSEKPTFYSGSIFRVFTICHGVYFALLIPKQVCFWKLLKYACKILALQNLKSSPWVIFIFIFFTIFILIFQIICFDLLNAKSKNPYFL